MKINYKTLLLTVTLSFSVGNMLNAQSPTSPQQAAQSGPCFDYYTQCMGSMMVAVGSLALVGAGCMAAGGATAGVVGAACLATAQSVVSLGLGGTIVTITGASLVIGGTLLAAAQKIIDCNNLSIACGNANAPIPGPSSPIPSCSTDCAKCCHLGALSYCPLSSAFNCYDKAYGTCIIGCVAGGNCRCTTPLSPVAQCVYDGSACTQLGGHLGSCSSPCP
jgi:hypothetical protein